MLRAGGFQFAFFINFFELLLWLWDFCEFLSGIDRLITKSNFCSSFSKKISGSNRKMQFQIHFLFFLNQKLNVNI